MSRKKKRGGRENPQALIADLDRVIQMTGKPPLEMQKASIGEIQALAHNAASLNSDIRKRLLSSRQGRQVFQSLKGVLRAAFNSAIENTAITLGLTPEEWLQQAKEKKLGKKATIVAIHTVFVQAKLLRERFVQIMSSEN